MSRSLQLRVSAGLMVWAVGIASLGGSVLCASARAQVAGEYQVKAAYLYQFLNFTGWPENAFASAESAFTICVLGTDPFGGVLDDTVRGKTVRGRPVQARKLNDLHSIRGCHVLFIAASERTRLPWVMEAAAGFPVLTVSESDDFETQGGMVRFAIDRGTIRLRINPDASAAAGLQISSKLLAVATVVRRRPRA